MGTNGSSQVIALATVLSVTPSILEIAGTLKPESSQLQSLVRDTLIQCCSRRLQHRYLERHRRNGSNSPMKAPVKPRVDHLPCVRVVPLL